jgi:hypothetical protein
MDLIQCLNGFNRLNDDLLSILLNNARKVFLYFIGWQPTFMKFIPYVSHTSKYNFKPVLVYPS